MDIDTDGGVSPVTSDISTNAGKSINPVDNNNDGGPAKNPTPKPRKPHHKSRTGCLQCKQRKVKCDEQKPICAKCLNHNQSCSYLLTYPVKRGPPTVQSMLASPSPTSATGNSNTVPPPTASLAPGLPANFTILDLEILHHWTTRSVESFVDFQSCIDLFRVTVVEMGFDYPFLLHEILALTALHMSRVKPHKAATYRHASDTHLALGLAAFQPEIANLNLNNCHACWAFSTMTFTHAWASQEPTKPSTLFFTPPVNILDDPDVVHVQWVKLHRGSHFMLRELFPSLKDGPMEPLFAPWKDLRDLGAPYDLSPNEEAPLTALPNAWLLSQMSQAEKDVLSEAARSLTRIFSLLAFNPEISKLSAVMSWFSVISDEFLKMLEIKVPEAMLIVAYYCVAIKKADYMWWVRDKGENLLRTVMGELGPGERWQTWLKWPKEQVLHEVEFSSAGGGMRIGRMLG